MDKHWNLLFCKIIQPFQVLVCSILRHFSRAALKIVTVARYDGLFNQHETKTISFFKCLCMLNHRNQLLSYYLVIERSLLSKYLSKVVIMILLIVEMNGDIKIVSLVNGFTGEQFIKNNQIMLRSGALIG